MNKWIGSILNIKQKNFRFSFQKKNEQKTRAEIVTLEKKLKELEQNPENIFYCNYASIKISLLKNPNFKKKM